MYIQGTDSHRRAWPPVRRHCKQLSCRHLHRHLKGIKRGGGRKRGEGEREGREKERGGRGRKGCGQILSVAVQ